MLIYFPDEFDENRPPELLALLFKRSFRLKAEATGSMVGGMLPVREGSQAARRKMAVMPKHHRPMSLKP